MSKFCAENEAVKRQYVFFLQAAEGKQTPTVDSALHAIERFEKSTNWKPFKKFHVEQARAFRARLVSECGPDGRPLSAATIITILKRLRHFFGWLSGQTGFRSRIKASDAAYFTPSEQDRRIASARRSGYVPTLEEIKRVLAAMPARTIVERRNRALIAFIILTGSRDGAAASFRLKHLDLEARTLLQDGREVKTKGRKTFVSYFFPVGDEPIEILADYIRALHELGFGPDDPLFPATKVGSGAGRTFEADGLTRRHWATAAPIRLIFRDAFEAVGLPYAKPHSFRKTLARLGEKICGTPEAWKSWSQNFGHESEMTTFVGYGIVPSHRQGEILRNLGSRSASSITGLDIDALAAFVASARAKPLE